MGSGIAQCASSMCAPIVSSDLLGSILGIRWG